MFDQILYKVDSVQILHCTSRIRTLREFAINTQHYTIHVDKRPLTGTISDTHPNCARKLPPSLTKEEFHHQSRHALNPTFNSTQELPILTPSRSKTRI